MYEHSRWVLDFSYYATGIDVFASGCPKAHTREALCCKSRNEYWRYFNSTKKSGELYRWSSLMLTNQLLHIHLIGHYYTIWLIWPFQYYYVSRVLEGLGKRLSSDENKISCWWHRWYCHIDDDHYVNIPVLVPALREAMSKSHDGGVYFGRWPGEMVPSMPKGLRVSYNVMYLYVLVTIWGRFTRGMLL